MTLNDLIRKAQALAMQMSSGDVPLSKDIDFEIATYKGELYGIIVDVKEPMTMNKAERRALEAYPRDDDMELNFRRATIG